MRLDRDLNVALVAAVWPGGSRRAVGWEMLSATGVRGLRLLHETGAFAAMTLTEAHPAAAAVAGRNAGRYAAEGAVARVHDARRPVDGGPFDYVDLDPFGTPQPFVESALGSVRPGGLLAVTATDLPVLTGVARGVCERRYGARPIRGSRGVEGGLRILLAVLAREAGRRSRSVEPVLAYAHDHYVRAYLRVRASAGGPPSPPPVALVPPEGGAWPELPPGGPYGPLWTGPLFDPGVVAALAVPASASRPGELERLLERLRAEAAADVPFYYEPNGLAESLRLAQPPSLERLLERLRASGYAAARSHIRPSAFRTTAPRPVVEAAARDLTERSGQSQNARVRA